MQAPHPQSPFGGSGGSPGTTSTSLCVGDVIRVVSDTSSVPAVCWVAVDRVEVTSMVATIV